MNRTSSLSRSIDIDSAMISSLVCILIILGFIRSSDQFLHWFIIPILLNGILIGIDAVDWFRGRLSLFDPVGILGLLGVHFFFITPLLHVSWDDWLGLVTPPDDWRTWLGAMAALNFLGLLIYRFVRGLNFTSTTIKLESTQQRDWQLDQKRFPGILCIALIISVGLQALVYQRFGGISGYIGTATRSVLEAREAFAGMGILFLISETFPVLAMIGFAVYSRKHKSLRTPLVLIIVLVIFLVLKLLFGGLRGSRSLTVWAVFWAVGIIHFWIRPISRKAIAIGLAFLLFFMYFYGFFKASGLEGLKTSFASHEERVRLEEESGRTWEVLLLRDLGRSDVQAFLLYRITRPDSDYEYAWGRTYIAATSILVPKIIWSNKPLSKTKEGTEAIYGRGAYAMDRWESSNVFGLAGEAMLNFGPFSVPLFFAILGFLVGQVQRWLYTWHPSDTRMLILPMLINFCFVVLVSDLDNNLAFLVHHATLPFLVILLSSRSIPRLQHSPDFCLPKSPDIKALPKSYK